MPPTDGRATRQAPPLPPVFFSARRWHPGQPEGPPPARGQRRHGRLPLPGLDPFGRLPPRRQSRLKRQPPAKGQRRHGRLPLLDLDPAAFVVRRHGRAEQPGQPPPAKGQRRHGRLPLLDLDPTAFVAPRHWGGQRGAKAPPYAGKVRRGRLPNFGLAAPQANYSRRRRRKPAGSPWWTWRIPHRRPPRLPRLVLTRGPYYLAAGQVYAGGIVDGQAESTT